MRELIAALPTCPLTQTECSHVSIRTHPGCVFPQQGSLKHFAAHETVFNQDSGCRGLWRMRDGYLALRRYHPDGGRTIVRVVRPGEIIGWADAFITGVHRWEAWTLTASSLWYLTASDWAAFHSGTVHDRVLALAYAECQKLESTVMRLSNLKAEDRLLAFLLSMADDLSTSPVEVHLPLRRCDMAEVVAITPECCSRLLHRLQEQGLVTWPNANFALVDQRAVSRVAEAIDLF